MSRTYTDVPLPFLGRWRQRRRLTQAELAELIGTSRTHISDLERGTKKARLRTVEKLAVALKISVDELQHEPPPITKSEK